jgi:hypothetical protein
VLDYYYNTSGYCACNNTGPEGVCVPGQYPAAEAGTTQYLVVGDRAAINSGSQLHGGRPAPLHPLAVPSA